MRSKIAQLAALVFFLVFFWLVACHGQDGGENASGTPASSLGRTVPAPVGTTSDCRAPGFVLAVGTIDQLIGVVPNNSTAALILKANRGKRGQLVFIPETVKR